MMELNIYVKGLATLQRRLGRIGTFAVVQPTMQRVVMRIWDDVARYPAPPPRGIFAGFASERQRRWFFAALRRGEIRVPYVRTGTLGRSWSTRVFQDGGGLVGQIGTRLSYAPYVQDHERQAAIHRRRWQTVQDVFRRLRPWVLKQFRDAVQGALRWL